MKPLSDFYTPNEIAAMTRSWLAFSATNICFSLVHGKVRLLLGVRGQPARSIPEPGELCLIGGFNTEVAAPAMLEAVANAHLEAQLGLDFQMCQCSDFLPCEYNMHEIDAPLKTAVGPLDIKRVAFDRVVWIREDFVNHIRPKGKISDTLWVTKTEFNTLVDSGKLSFPHQIDHVFEGFRVAENSKAGVDAYRTTWMS